MSDLRDLYQELILDHNNRPRNKGRLEGADRVAKGHNPLCGDHITVYVKVKDGIVEQVSFEGSGCAISTASASLMTESLRGKTLEEAKALFLRFHGLVTGDPSENGESGGLGKLDVFSNVCQYPARVKCATLAWHTIRAALEDANGVVSTE
jgi:nitrogen fixation NifU-like protein